MKDGSVRVSVFALGLLGLSWPLIEIFRPSVVPYVFGLWSALILLALLAQGLSDRQEPAGGRNRPPL